MEKNIFKKSYKKFVITKNIFIFVLFLKHKRPGQVDKLCKNEMSTLKNSKSDVAINTITDVALALMTSTIQLDMSEIEAAVNGVISHVNGVFIPYTQLLKDFDEDVAYMVTGFDVTEEYFYDAINRGDVDRDIIKSLVTQCVSFLSI